MTAETAPPVPQTRVLVGMPNNYGTVPIEFFSSMLALQVPKVPGGCSMGHGILSGRHQAAMREGLCEIALKHDFTHLLMVDTDMVYPPYTLERLLAADVDVICGFAMSKLFPHRPIFGPLGTERWTFAPRWPTENGKPDGKRLEGPQPSFVMGGAALMIRMEVLHRLPRPWFSFQAHTSDGTEAGEDIWFSQLCADHEIQAYVHMDVIVHHLTRAQIIPHHTPGDEQIGENGIWGVQYLPQWGKHALEQQTPPMESGPGKIALKETSVEV